MMKFENLKWLALLFSVLLAVGCSTTGGGEDGSGSGSVLLVNIEKSSGNLSFDRSVEQAVYKADPLPMPESPRLLAQFREIVLKFDPGK